ncbi:glycosyltransferase [Dyadobacter sp. CY326]|uniref:glycosyltransferase n=1 Tax=Dyadobacter sp. CY326 TaxID=2907300 RepID=UPI001F2470C3|nr:glycosyltransferase [Dyadobacter sp. CY326]MCE7068335.1 glycosyltransferase [Dyadobacter sp. CY326]
MRRPVLLVSTVHPAHDPRIFYKIAPSLAKEFEVFCALPNASARHDDDQVCMIALPAFQNLFLRLLFSHSVLLWKCLRLRPDLIHIFVPELIPAAFLFKWLGALVIYEVQENLYKKFSIKTSNNAKAYQALFRYFDHCARKHFYCIFTEDAYLEEYRHLTLPAAVVHNFASLSMIDTYAEDGNSDNAFPELIYSGVISLERSFDTLVSALAKLKKTYPDFRMHLFGFVRISSEEIENIAGYQNIAKNLIFYGYTDQKTVLKFAKQSIAGIALLKPVADYPDSYTTKLFDYMALGLPVITSDFPLYQRVVEQSECGFCISPYDADLLFEKMKWLIVNPAERIRMGKNGRNAVEKSYNWAQEESILLAFYRNLLHN